MRLTNYTSKEEMFKKKPKSLEYTSNEKQQVITVTGEIEDVRYFTHQLIDSINQQDYLRESFKKLYDDIEQKGTHNKKIR